MSAVVARISRELSIIRTKLQTNPIPDLGSALNSRLAAVTRPAAAEFATELQAASLTNNQITLGNLFSARKPLNQYFADWFNQLIASRTKGINVVDASSLKVIFCDLLDTTKGIFTLDHHLVRKIQQWLKGLVCDQGSQEISRSRLEGIKDLIRLAFASKKATTAELSDTPITLKSARARLPKLSESVEPLITNLLKALHIRVIPKT